MPTVEGMFYLDTDASDLGLGAVLSQSQDGCEKVIAYTSRALSKAERNYDVTRRELLAVVFGLKMYKQYVMGRHFVIRTDHAALQWLRKTPEPMAQLARWLTFIEQFDFEVTHRAGTKHGNADGLSRKPVDPLDGGFKVRGVTADGSPSKVNTSEVVPDSAGESITALQLNDSEIGPVAGFRLHQEEPPDISRFLS